MRIATRVIDITYGRSAAGVRARLERACRDGWITLADAETETRLRASPRTPQTPRTGSSHR
jgi:5-hydroxyisourate hydrolase